MVVAARDELRAIARVESDRDDAVAVLSQFPNRFAVIAAPEPGTDLGDLAAGHQRWPFGAERDEIDPGPRSISAQARRPVSTSHDWSQAEGPRRAAVKSRLPSPRNAAARSSPSSPRSRVSSSPPAFQRADFRPRGRENDRAVRAEGDRIIGNAGQMERLASRFAGGGVPDSSRSVGPRRRDNSPVGTPSGREHRASVFQNRPQWVELPLPARQVCANRPAESFVFLGHQSQALGEPEQAAPDIALFALPWRHDRAATRLKGPGITVAAVVRFDAPSRPRSARQPRPAAQAASAWPCAIRRASRPSRATRPKATTAPIAPSAKNTATAGRRRTQRGHRPSYQSAALAPARRQGNGAASASSAAVRSRRTGSLFRHLRQIVSRSRGNLGCNRDGAIGSSWTTWASASRNDAPTNGGRPVSSSYRIAPKAYIPAPGPTSLLWPVACSVAMYPTVPRMSPLAVRSRLAVGQLGQTEVDDLGLPSDPSSTLLGVRSRWITPRSWAEWVARAIVSTNRAWRRESHGLP